MSLTRAIASFGGISPRAGCLVQCRQGLRPDERRSNGGMPGTHFNLTSSGSKQRRAVNDETRHPTRRYTLLCTSSFQGEPDGQLRMGHLQPSRPLTTHGRWGPCIVAVPIQRSSCECEA